MDRIVLTLPLDIAYVRTAAILSRVLCEPLVEPELLAEFAGSVELAVSEACTNAVKYARTPGGAETYQAVFLVGSDRFCIEVVDQGPGFDLDAVPQPDFDAHAIGGYGVYLIRDRMDDVSYERTPGGNILRMTKYVPGAKGEAT